MNLKSIPAIAEQRIRVKRRLLTWFRRHGRDLPWRRTRDPYQILVSEVMLQQTQVSRVEGYWARFLERFPTIHHLAEAPPRRVQESWAGLGYYRRATNLHLLAREVVTHHGGELPRDVTALRALPGVGAYTAGAVASFAYELPEPAVDTNVARVLRRIFHPRLPPGAKGEKQLWATASTLVSRRGLTTWTINQALMELGALICTARVKHCDRCPVRDLCRTGAVQLRGATRKSATVRSRSRGRT
ncbi:MAG: A/G-specific adenine glycosylase [Gemmatimonadota bacterium]